MRANMPACSGPGRIVASAPDFTGAHRGVSDGGGNIALSFAVKYPATVASLIIVGSGSGTVAREQFIAESERLARVFEERGAAIAGWEIAQRPGRRIYAEKDPRGYSEFLE